MKKDLFLITGASTGIGFALTEHFAKKGHFVLAGVRSAKDFDSLATLANVKPIYLDMTRNEHLEAIESTIASLIADYNKLVLINNAGIVVNGPWELIPQNEIRNQFEVNFFGLVFLTQKCLPFLRKTQGHVINISSVSGLFATPFLGPYAASKMALEGFSDSLRREVFRFGVKVTTINPAAIKTPIWDKGLKNPHNRLFVDNPAYGAILKKFERGAMDVISGALDVSYVIKAVDSAYGKTKPPAQVIVARASMRIPLKLIPILPKRWIDALFKRF